jgi:hypothetical protein
VSGMTASQVDTEKLWGSSSIGSSESSAQESRDDRVSTCVKFDGSCPGHALLPVKRGDTGRGRSTYLSNSNQTGVILACGPLDLQSWGGLGFPPIEIVADQCIHWQFPTEVDLSSAAIMRLPDRGFYFHRGLSIIRLPGTLRIIGAECFAYSGMSQIDVSHCVELVLGDGCFANCGQLTHGEIGPW